MIPSIPHSRPFRSADRAASEVLGSILVFGLLLVVLVIIQFTAVPQANDQIEFDHNQRVQTDMQSLEGAIDRTAASGQSESTSIEAGVRYPSRLFLLNPGPASGAMRTEPGTIAVANAVAIDTEADDYWDGTTRTSTTRRVAYRPNYNYYDTAPTTVYENGVLYNAYPDDVVVTGRSDVVSGRRIALTALDGTLSTTSSGAVIVEATPVSAPARTISVTDAEGSTGPIEIRLDTGLPLETWEQLLEAEIDAGGDSDPDRYIDQLACTEADASLPCGTLTITMEQGYTYDLRLAKVGIGSDTTDEEPQYLVDSTDDTSMTVGAATALTVQARDGLNADASGVTVTYTLQRGGGHFADADGGNLGQSVDVTTDEQGAATAVFVPTSNAAVTIVANASLDADDTTVSAREQVRFNELNVGGGDDDGDDGELNPNAPGRVAQVGARLVNCQSAETNNQVDVFDPDCEVEVTFQNLGSTPKSIDRARVSFYSADQAFKTKGSSPFSKRPNPETATLGTATMTVRGPSVDIGTLTGLAAAGDPGDTQTYTVRFFLENPDSNTGSQDRYNVVQGDFYVMAIIFDDGSTGQYIVGPVDDEP